MKTKTVAILVLLSGLFGGIIATVARPHPQEKPDQLSESEALALMRTINTLEIVAFSEDPRHQYYVSLDELVVLIHQNGRKQWPLELKGDSTGTLKDYTVSVVVSADGQHYAVQMISSSSCRLAVFSNEDALIYTAKALGCPDEKSPNEGAKAN